MVTRFQEQVYALVQQIPKGKVSSYGDLALVLKSAPRAIGQALRCNPYAPRVPCHRVVSSNGTVGGFGGHITGPCIEEKMGLLVSEGIIIIDNKIKNFEKKRFTLSSF